MQRDPLSETLALADARNVISGEFRAGGSWAVRFRPDAPVKLDAVVHGATWLVVDDAPPVRIVAGDAVVLNGASSMVFCSDLGLRPVDAADEPPPAAGRAARHGDAERDDVVVLGGHVDLDPATAGMFTSALPLVTHVSAASAEAAEMRRLLQRIIEESTSDRPGAGFATNQHAQLLLLQVLRVGIERDALTRPGWLRLLADPQLRRAVSAMHAEPGRAWGLDDLASAAGMSRSHFAHRFREVSGQPPLNYLSGWRIRLAQRALLEPGTTVAALAGRLGYASESSFSHAFTRVTGASPSQFRSRNRSRSNPPGRAT
ncbi:AraC family transcriptional regulator [Myceligenerans xiligouense]|uniref:AraC family transcriptional regulator n=1 Tax=Myceligenerans xiligouense TaxID=253184 RepID=A0A3N4YU14_9MICO|nr:AraC family transcriptional regulator [Myceligenerans xiligouense]RPF22070.1 AraC family transcriptional regulator [Myceligenerans xiligouense]